MRATCAGKLERAAVAVVVAEGKPGAGSCEDDFADKFAVVRAKVRDDPVEGRSTATTIVPEAETFCESEPVMLTPAPICERCHDDARRPPRILRATQDREVP